MSEKLSLIIRQNEQSNVEATKQVIKDIKKLLIEASQNKEKPDATLHYEVIEINLPIERQLTFTPAKEVEYKDIPQDAVLGIGDLERIGKLYNPYYVDRKVLRSRIDRLLKDNGQTTIAEVIAQNSGVENGLSELLGYIAVLKEYKTVVSTERTQSIAFCDDKSIEIPEIIITR